MFSARLLGLAEHRVRVIARDVGGGFGQKVMPLREDMCVLLAARKLPAAVKWIEDRQENLMTAGQARHEHGTARIALDHQGIILRRPSTTCRTSAPTRRRGRSAPARSSG